MKLYVSLFDNNIVFILTANALIYLALKVALKETDNLVRCVIFKGIYVNIC